jgi:branched-chain amino acid transport system permease protein
MSFWLGVLVQAAIYALAGIVATQMQRLLGLISVAHGLVMGTGAYVYAVVATAGYSPALAFVIATVAGIVTGIAMVSLSARTVGDYFALVTFALQIVWSTAVANIRPVLGGAVGKSGIPWLPFVPESNALSIVGFCLVLLIILTAALLFLSRTAFPQICAVIARSRELAATLGLPAGRARIQLGTIYGFALGSAGAVLAAYLSVIEPGMFGTRLSVAILAIAFAGVAIPDGIGVLVGVLLIAVAPQLLRLLDVPNPRVAALQLMVAGIGVFACAATVLRRRLAGGVS